MPASAASLGPADAKVTIVEFLDYQCPYCHRAQESVDEVLKEYQGKVRFVHRDYLLGKPRSLAAARAARCAGEQGKFWEYHRGLLVQAGDLSDADLDEPRQGSRPRRGPFREPAPPPTSSTRTSRVPPRRAASWACPARPPSSSTASGPVGARTEQQFQEMIDAELQRPRLDERSDLTLDLPTPHL